MPRKRLTGPILALTLVLGACGASDSPAVNQPPQSSPTTAADPRIIAPPQQIGPGYLRAATPDGSAVYVSDPDPSFPEPGCEGAPESVLFRLPLSGGEREVLRNGNRPLKDLIVRGPGGKLALVDICEGFFDGLQVGTESAGGKITGLKDVKLNNDPKLGQPAAFSISWSNDGSRLLAAINHPDAPDADPSRVVAIDPQTGAVTELFSGGQGSGVFQVAQLENGTYVIAGNRVVTFRDARGKVTSTFKGNGFTLTPDRRSVVMYGEQLTIASQTDAQARLLVGQKEQNEISGANVSPDAQAVIFTRYSLSAGMSELGLVTLADAKFSSIVTSMGLGKSLFTGDGRGVAFTTINGAGGSAGVQLASLGGRP